MWTGVLWGLLKTSNGFAQLWIFNTGKGKLRRFFLLDFLRAQSSAKTIRLASLVDKPCRRASELEYIKPDYCCFTIDDKFILGYGLDYEQNFRELPYIGFVDGLA